MHAARRLRYEFWASQALEKQSNSHPRSGNTHIGDEHVRISRAGATFLQLDSQICSWIRGSDAVHLSMQHLAHGIPLQALSPQGSAGCAQRTSINLKILNRHQFPDLEISLVDWASASKSIVSHVRRKHTDPIDVSLS